MKDFLKESVSFYKNLFFMFLTALFGIAYTFANFEKLSSIKLGILAFSVLFVLSLLCVVYAVYISHKNKLKDLK